MENHTITTIKLSHIYGGSYFGSGGAYGAVNCCRNCRPVGRQDNGFVAGATKVEVIDPTRPARFYARGGDMIGDGRDWSESAEWDPKKGWTPSSGHRLPSKEERQLWLRACEAEAVVPATAG